MKPPGHVQATIDLVTVYCKSKKIPADTLLGQYLKARRYIGAKDKKRIAHFYYGLMRNLGLYEWMIDQAAISAAQEVAPGRLMMIIHLLHQGDDLSSYFDGSLYGPAPLSDDEQALIKTAMDLMKAQKPEGLSQGIPPDLLGIFKKEYGHLSTDIIAALNQEAPFDFRVNPLKIERPSAVARLAQSGIIPTITPFSPFGLRLEGRASRQMIDILGAGALEVQDEASQLAAWLVGAKPGQRVLDLCAGACGKTLLMAASMENKGHIIAADISALRLHKGAQRLKRAGVHNTQTRVIEPMADRWLLRQKNSFDCVYVDVPCSGSGTWRRNPDLKWKVSLSSLQDLTLLQKSLLKEASVAVKKGGRLVYSTCSLFAQENEDQVNGFLLTNPHFSLVPIPLVWNQVFKSPYPFEDVSYFKVNPLHHHMDGFFMAIFKKDHDL